MEETKSNTKLNIDLIQKEKKVRKIFDKEHMVLCLQNIPTNQTSHKVLIQFLWMSGSNITEACSLQRKDIDFDKDMMTVKKLKSRKYFKRIVPIHPELRGILILYTATMKVEDNVFPISRQRAWQIVKKYVGGSPSRLRHGFAINWLKCDGSIVFLHEILGNNKFTSTLKYQKEVPLNPKKEFDKIKFY
jgi:integrase